MERLLDGLESQEFANRPPLVKLLIVDNSSDANARSICERWRDRLGMALTYVHEARPGIAPARNRALDSVDQDTEWIAFIDDDEVPAADWLDCLLRGQRAFEADVVGGPVVPHFGVPPPLWVRRGRFFDMVRRPTGTRLREAYTNNVMFRAALVRELDLRFDERLTHGEDTVFFRRIADAGCSIVWVGEARVEEWITEERLTEAWLTERRYQSGVLHGTLYRDYMAPQTEDLPRDAPVFGGQPLVAVRRSSRPWVRARITAKVVHKLLLGGGLLSLSPVLPRQGVVRARGRLAYALGVLETVRPRAEGEWRPDANDRGGPFVWMWLLGSRLVQDVVRVAVWKNATETSEDHDQ